MTEREAREVGAAVWAEVAADQDVDVVVKIVDLREQFWVMACERGELSSISQQLVQLVVEVMP